MILTFFNDFNVLASFTVFIYALCFSIWLTFVMHRYRRRAEMSRRRIARVELSYSDPLLPHLHPD